MEISSEIREYFPERILREVIEAENREQEEKAAELFSWLREHKYM